MHELLRSEAIRSYTSTTIQEESLMAANMKSVKLRIKSVESTMQITKAMELVASSKLRKAKDRADTCRPYFRELHQTLVDIAEGNLDFSSIYARKSSSEKYCYIVIAGDRAWLAAITSTFSNAWRKPVPDRISSFCPSEKRLWNTPTEGNFRSSPRNLPRSQRFPWRTALRWRASLLRLQKRRIRPHRTLLYELRLHALSGAGSLFHASPDRSHRS